MVRSAAKLTPSSSTSAEGIGPTRLAQGDGAAALLRAVGMVLEKRGHPDVLPDRARPLFLDDLREQERKGASDRSSKR